MGRIGKRKRIGDKPPAHGTRQMPRVSHAYMRERAMHKHSDMYMRTYAPAMGTCKRACVHAQLHMHAVARMHTTTLAHMCTHKKGTLDHLGASRLSLDTTFNFE